MEEKLLTINEFAAAVSCTVAAVRKWARDRRVATVKISGLVRIPASEVDRMIVEGMQPVIDPKRKDRNSTPENQVTAITLARKESRTAANRGKKRRPRIAVPKILRIEQRHLAGESDRQIARAEHCSRNTIAKIVKAPEQQEYLQGLREKIWGGLDDAADVVLENVRQNRDAKMSYELLRDAGLLPRAAQVVYQPQQPMTTEEEMVKDQMVKMAYIAYETAKTYGGGLPDLSGLEIRAPNSTDGKEKIESKTDVNAKKPLKS